VIGENGDYNHAGPTAMETFVSMVLRTRSVQRTHCLCNCLKQLLLTIPVAYVNQLEGESLLP
jgi:hypothetical protein